MSGEIWRLWRDGAHSPWFNMAADELLQNECNLLNEVVLRFYSFDIPSCSFGYSQFPDAVPERAKGFLLVRRPTGGGIVFHDNDLTYTLAIPPGNPILKLDRMASYRVVHEAVMLGLTRLGTHSSLAPEPPQKHDRATLQCFRSPSQHDIMLDGSTAKLAGAAQRRGRLGILHQGSIALEAAHGRGKDALIEAVQTGMQEYFKVEYKPFEPREEFLAEAEHLGKIKYSTPEWNEKKLLPGEVVP